MNKSFKNIGVSILLVILLANTNLSFAYYVIVEDDDTRASAFTTQGTSSPPLPVKPLVVTGPDVNHQEPIISTKTAPAKISKKILPLGKNHIARCPSEVACGNGDTRPVNYTIPFLKARTDITEDSKKRLNALIPRIKGSKVCILGRPDMITYTNGHISSLASSRAYNIRKYLLHNGIPSESITVSAMFQPYTSDDGLSFNSDVIVIEKKEIIEKRKVNLHHIEISTPFKNVSNLSTNTLMRENAMVSLIDSNNASISYIENSIKEGSIQEATGNHIKAMIKFNEIRVLKNLSYNRSM